MSSKGFTKIEILLVIILAVIVISVDIFVILYLNSKARDIQTLSEIDQIRSGLELFLQTNNYYPKITAPTELNDSYAGTEKLCFSGFSKITEKCDKNILSEIPNVYQNKGNIYTYQANNDYLNYKLEFTLLTNFKRQGLAKGKNCATNSQTTSQLCF